MSKRKPKRKQGRPTRGTLMTIAVLLLGSAALRIGLNASQAIALQTPVHTEEEGEQSVACTTPGDFGAMLEAFQEREARIAEQEDQIRKRMRALSIADEKIEAKLASLVDAEARLRETISLADGAAENDLTRLTAVYENMKPKDASALFEQMDPEFSAGFLARMKPAAAAAIMAGLSADKAYSISVILAGRNANVPSE